MLALRLLLAWLARLTPLDGDGESEPYDTHRTVDD